MPMTGRVRDRGVRVRWRRATLRAPGAPVQFSASRVTVACGPHAAAKAFSAAKIRSCPHIAQALVLIGSSYGLLLIKRTQSTGKCAVGVAIMNSDGPSNGPIPNDAISETEWSKITWEPLRT